MGKFRLVEGQNIYKYKNVIYYDENKATSLVNNYINEFIKLTGVDLYNLEWINFSFDGFHNSNEESGALGCTSIEYKPNKHKFSTDITLNWDIMIAGIEDVIKNNVFHEICHVLQFWLALNILQYQGIDLNHLSDSELGEIPYFIDKEIYSKTDPSGTGHDNIWKSFASDVNSLGVLRYPVTPFVSEEVNEARAKAYHEEKIYYQLRCDNCGQTYSYYKFSFDWDTLLVMFMKDHFNNPIFQNMFPPFKCDTCGVGEYQLKIIDSKLKDFLVSSSEAELITLIVERKKPDFILN